MSAIVRYSICNSNISGFLSNAMKVSVLQHGRRLCGASKTISKRRARMSCPQAGAGALASAHLLDSPGLEGVAKAMKLYLDICGWMRVRQTTSRSRSGTTPQKQSKMRCATLVLKIETLILKLWLFP